MPSVSVIMPAYQRRNAISDRGRVGAAAVVLRSRAADCGRRVVGPDRGDRPRLRGARRAGAGPRTGQCGPRARRATPASAPPPDACSPFSTATTSGTRRFSTRTDRASSTPGPTSTSSSATRATAAAPRDGQPSRPIRGEGRPIALAEILADETCAVHHGGVPARGRRRDRRLRPGAADQRGVRDVDPRRARRVHLYAPHQAARLVCVPARQPVVERHADAAAASCACSRRRGRSLAPGSPERSILDRQVARFEIEFAAAEARGSLAKRRLPRGRAPPGRAARAARRLALAPPGLRWRSPRRSPWRHFGCANVSEAPPELRSHGPARGPFCQPVGGGAAVS